MAKSGKTKRKSESKRLRNQKIIEEAVQGKTIQEIAESYGMNRNSIAQILNSDEVKTLLKLGEARLQMLMTKAIDVLDWTLENKGEFGVTGAASQNARAILKSLGVLKEQLDLNHTFPKPVVIEKSDGSEIILGAKEDENHSA